MSGKNSLEAIGRRLVLVAAIVATGLGGGLAGGIGGRAFAAPTSEGECIPDKTRVLVQTSFEEGDAALKAPQHQLVKGVARTGNCSLMGEVARPGQARILDVPFEAKKGRVVHVSFWVRSDEKSACATFVRIGKERTRIGTKIDRVPAGKWKRVWALYRAEADTSGVIQIAAPSSWGAPAGRVWIDDLTVIEAEDECRWPAHVEDFPALACDEAGRLWLAALARPTGRRFVCLYRIDGGGHKAVYTLEPERLTGIAAPAVAALDTGCVVVFPVEQEDRWRIAYAFVDDRTPRRPACRYIDGEGTANISPAVAVAGSRACVVWESNGGDARGIYSCWVDRNGASRIARISSADANSYNPAIAALKDGTLLAAWDTVRNKRADIYGAWCRNGQWQAAQRITSDARIERHPSLATRNGRIWMTWQAQSYAGRKLNSLTEQRIVVARIDGSRLLAPRGLFQEVSTGERLLLRPRIAFDGSGRLWLTARESIGQHAGWRPVAWCYSGNAWSEQTMLMHQPGRWRPVNVAPTPAGPVAACQYDDIPQSGGHHGINADWRSGIALKALSRERMSPAGRIELESLSMPETDFSLAQRIELCSAELPRQYARHGGEELTLFWGDLHDHTDLSICARSTNPPGHDLFANERDIELLDFCALTDHGFDLDALLWAYNGEQTRNNHDPGRFVTFLGQEWTSSKNPPAIPGNPNRYGHHNLIYLDPYYGRFHDAFDGDISPADLWQQLQGVEFVCIPHQLADWRYKGKGNPPTDWNYVNEKLQPVAEIFQARESYEYLGCPRQSKHGTPFKGYYLQDAWARGIIIGTIASPDHGGGCGKVGVWAKELTRESIFDALRARHTFGTSGAKMGLLFTAGRAMMGDKVKRPDGAISFHVRAVARHDIKELVIFRNNEIVHRVEPDQNELALDWTDDNPLSADMVWYYARIHAEDNELAWSSPIWSMPSGSDDLGSDGPGGP